MRHTYQDEVMVVMMMMLLSARTSPWITVTPSEEQILPKARRTIPAAGALQSFRQHFSYRVQCTSSTLMRLFDNAVEGQLTFLGKASGDMMRRFRDADSFKKVPLLADSTRWVDRWIGGRRQ